MNYKEKYFKYKKKYINLKDQLAGTNNSRHNLIQELVKLYPSCKFDNGLSTSYDDHKITYGEMDYDGLNSLIKYLNINFTSFIDIGSGRGKICFYILKYPEIQKSFGIEIVKERHEDALELKNKLSHFNETKNVQFINDDFLNVNLQDFQNSKPLIWFSNLCFTEKITNDIYNKIINEMPTETIICSSKIPTINSNKLSKIGETQIKMSWNSTSNVYCYKIN